MIDVSTPDAMSKRAPVSRAVLLTGISALLVAAAGCGTFTARGFNAEGVRLLDQARYQEAVQQFQKAIENDPASADAYYNLAAAYHRVGAAAGRQAELTQAENYYNLCLNRDPNHRECHRGLAVLLVEQNRSEEAFRLLQAWADRNPASPDPKIEMARLSEEFGDREAAKQQLAEALLIDPRNQFALAALGRLREQSGDYQMALNNYQQSLQIDPSQSEIAARVAALQPRVGSSTLATAPADYTRTVLRSPNPLR
jgi:tetratricopeptide (TPR) repeat protein